MFNRVLLNSSKRVISRVISSSKHSSLYNKSIVNCYSVSSVPFSTRKSWMPQDDELLEKVYAQSMVHEVMEKQKKQTEEVVPWFLQNMPASYFKQVPQELQSKHVQAIAAVRELLESELNLRMATTDKDGAHYVTFISSGTNIGLLYKQLKALAPPHGHDLNAVDVFSSVDGAVALNMFTFIKEEDFNAAFNTASVEDAKHVLAVAEEIQSGKHAEDSNYPAPSPLFERAELLKYIENIAPMYASQSNPRRFLIQRMMYEKVKDNDGVEVHIEPHFRLRDKGDHTASWLTIAASNVLPEVMLRLCCAILEARGLDISRAHMDTVKNTEHNNQDSVVMLRLLVKSEEGTYNLNDNSDYAEILSHDLKRSKWLDNETTELGLQQFPSLGLDKAEVFTALCSMLHGPLSKEQPQQFTGISSIISTITAKSLYMNIATNITQLFLDRFNPHHGNPSKRMKQDDFDAKCLALQEKIGVLQNDVARAVLFRMLGAVKGTLRTNFFNEDRYALSMRIDPTVMSVGDMGTPNKPTPFGVFFVHGRHFNAFHCRFKDIARGGLRLVTPLNSDTFAQESARQFDEAYGLSHAQQLKNKDIPEGGSKGVILVNTPMIDKKSHFFAMRKAVKAFTDSMLDLIVDSSVGKLVDFYKKPELIYFGPDEQIIPSDIDWMVHRAAVRGYPIPDAVMSSKGENGFNHKEYGVTSEGVVVCLDVALRRSLNIDPNNQPFTVKVTGGPDGDVAGNLMKILFREYGDNAKIVGIADGFGVAEDPEGLDHAELLRLVHESKPITAFNPEKLSSKGILLDVNSEDGVARRNSMHFRVKADAFVPAGGRPSTINSDNYKKFFDDNGVPSSKLVVEGANIFITEDAREKLFREGNVQIVKDSSANKCGVITSSCEVAASMLLSKEEFMAIKPELVDDVLVKLRHLARLEAELLFREYRNYPGSLPDFAKRISSAINRVRDDVTLALENVEPSDPLFQELRPLIAENLPKKLAEVAGDRIYDRFPVQYQRNAIASALACNLVYNEGIQLVEVQPNDTIHGRPIEQVIASRAIEYHREAKRIKELVTKMQRIKDEKGSLTLGDLDPADEEKVLHIIAKGGARTNLDIF